MKKVLIMILALCMICASFVSCGNSEETQVKYLLYCGLNDADSGNQTLTVADAQEDARKIITDKGLGYTEYVTYGAYTDNGTVKGNDTLVYVICYAKAEDVEAVAKDIKKELNLASVLFEEVESSYSFVD